MSSQFLAPCFHSSSRSPRSPSSVGFAADGRVAPVGIFNAIHVSRATYESSSRSASRARVACPSKLPFAFESSSSVSATLGCTRRERFGRRVVPLVQTRKRSGTSTFLSPASLSACCSSFLSRVYPSRMPSPPQPRWRSCSPPSSSSLPTPRQPRAPDRARLLLSAMSFLESSTSSLRCSLPAVHAPFIKLNLLPCLARPLNSPHPARTDPRSNKRGAPPRDVDVACSPSSSSPSSTHCARFTHQHRRLLADELARAVTRTGLATPSSSSPNLTQQRLGMGPGNVGPEAIGSRRDPGLRHGGPSASLFLSASAERSSGLRRRCCSPSS